MQVVSAAVFLAGCARTSENIPVIIPPATLPTTTETPITLPPETTTTEAPTTTINERRLLQDGVKAQVSNLAFVINQLTDPNLPNQKISNSVTGDDSYVRLVTKYVARPDGALDRYRAKVVYAGISELSAPDTTDVLTLRVELDAVPGISEPELPGTDSYVEFDMIAERNWHIFERSAGGTEILFTTQDLSTVMIPMQELTDEQLSLSYQKGLDYLAAIQTLPGVPIPA